MAAGYEQSKASVRMLKMRAAPAVLSANLIIVIDLVLACLLTCRTFTLSFAATSSFRVPCRPETTPPRRVQM